MSQARCGDTPVQELASSLSLTDETAGGGVFDLDGGLLGVILPCEQRLVAVATTSIEAILQRGTSPEQQLEARYGLSVEPMSSETREYFKGTEGLLVRSVWIDHLADKAGIWPGDVVTAVNGQAVTTVSDVADRLAGADASADVTVQRGRRRLTVTLVATGDAPTPGAAAGAGVVLEKPAPTTFPIKSVLPESRAAAVGVKPGDRLIRIDQAEPRTVTQVERVINADPPRPAWLELIRDGRRFGVLLR
jgi:S1-C subfamily serine protease